MMGYKGSLLFSLCSMYAMVGTFYNSGPKAFPIMSVVVIQLFSRKHWDRFPVTTILHCECAMQSK